MYLSVCVCVRFVKHGFWLEETAQILVYVHVVYFHQINPDDGSLDIL